MPITIDRAGRVVIPADIRKRAGLTPGTELEIGIDEETGSVHLNRIVSPPRIEREGDCLVIRPTAVAAPLDINKLIDQERERWPW